MRTVDYTLMRGLPLRSSNPRRTGNPTVSGCEGSPDRDRAYNFGPATPCRVGSPALSAMQSRMG
jgi:hypothetical protein